ncbi:cellulase family glycosylhydrolase [Carboxylicivirga caseinilyticus]|uniref:cellulase family glycosylhydrolase n=1 Tax=Carboxylicivirga caseinilyticus TaxID=3417572 RepID=UPI003D355460|nr:cellulase family glycosylhydrolase [Marinilabiliaceae bacterium A049]
MRVVINYSVLLIIIIFSGCNLSTDTEVFRIKDGRLTDAHGQVFVIRGMNMPHAWFPEKSYHALDELVKYNVNCVRIVWEADIAVDDLHKIVERCIDLQMIPMIELHDATGDSTDAKLLDMVQYFVSDEMQSLVHRYERYLLLNIANEWGNHNTTDEYWRDAYKKTIAQMRQAGYKTTIVIDAPGWGQNMSPVIRYGQELLDFDPQHNLLFSVHMYGSWNDDTQIESELTKAQYLHLPIIVGEFGYNYNNGDNNLGCKVNHRRVLEVCDDLEIGYLPWSWTGNNKENQWLDIVSIEDWKSLTEWGEEILLASKGIKETAKKATVFK